MTNDLRETNDKDFEFFAIVDEAVGPENTDLKILSDGNRNGLNFLRFSACIQSFGKYNRNRRLWLSKWMRMMIEAENIVELLQRGTLAGENGHPIPPTGEVTRERICSIDPNNISHRFMNFSWQANDDLLYAVIETLDDGDGPGSRMMRHILQGLSPSFSARAIVPQRRNPDGSTDVVGPGRLVTYDRVILPSHSEAYINKEIPIENVRTLSDLKIATESFTNDMLTHSDKINRILDGLSPVMESAIISPTDATVSVKLQNNDRIIIAPEMKYRQDIRHLFGEM